MKYKKIKKLPQGVYKVYFENGQINFSFLWRSGTNSSLLFPICHEGFVYTVDKKLAKTILHIQSVMLQKI